MKGFGILGSLGLCLGLAMPFSAVADQGVDIASVADRTEITIGDRLNYAITVKYPEGGFIDLPAVLGNLGSFEVKDYQTSTPKREEGRLSQTWSFTLSTFTVGDYVIPPQWVEFRPGKTDSAQTFLTQPIAIKVKRTSPETVKDIADITSQEAPAVRRPWWLAVAVVLLGAAGYLAWRLLRKKHKGESGMEKPALPPFEEAMSALAALNAVSMVRQNRVRELCFELSLLLRRYLSRRYGVDALESTSSEFIELAAALPLPIHEKAYVPRFCEVTDPVKFASQTLLESDAGKLIDELRRFLEATRPQEPQTQAARKENPA